MQEAKKICSLSDLFSTNLGMPHKYYALGERIDETKEKIIKAHSYKKRKKVEKQLECICEDYEERNCIENDKYFAYGFSLAVQLMSEAFSFKIQ